MNTSSAMPSQSADASGLGKAVRAVLLGGILGGMVIWIYEAIVCVAIAAVSSNHPNPLSERDHRWLHVAFLLRRTGGPGCRASTRKRLVV